MLAFLTIVVLTQPFKVDDRPPQFWLGSSSAAFFEFAPPSGAGLDSVTTLCDALSASEKTGNYWCLKGDGTMDTGSFITLSASGVARTESLRVCPNGKDCGALTGQRLLTATSAYREGADVNRSGSITTGGLTMCWHGILSWLPPVEAHFTGLGTNGSGTWRTLLYVTSAGTVQIYASSGVCGGATTNVSSGQQVRPGEPTLVCLNWQASDGLYRVWVNGTAGGPSASFTTICGGGSGSRYSVGGYNNGGAPVSNAINGVTYGAFEVASKLSDARMAEIARAVLADTPSGSQEEALVFTRSSVGGFCPARDNWGSQLPPSRPCVSRDGERVNSTTTNLSLRGREFDNASWTKFGAVVAAPTVTADYAVAPDGTWTADRVEFADCAGATSASGMEQVYSTPTSPGSGSVWLRANYLLPDAGPRPGFEADGGVNSDAGTLPSVSLCTYGSTSGSRACQAKALTTQWGWYLIENQTWVGNLSYSIGCENRSATYSGASNTGAADVLVWGSQFEANKTRATSTVPTVNASQNRTAESNVRTTSVSQQSQCQAATVELEGGLASDDRVWLMTRENASSGNFIASYTQAQARSDAVGSASVSATSGGLASGGAHRWVTTWNGSTLAIYRDAVQTASTTTASTLNTATRISIGSSPDGVSIVDGWVSDVQVDPTHTRCRQ